MHDEEDSFYDRSEINQNDFLFERNISTETLQNLHSIWKDYKDAFFDFQKLLKFENSQENLRFLIFRLDFNEYYNELTKKKIILNI